MIKINGIEIKGCKVEKCIEENIFDYTIEEHKYHHIFTVMVDTDNETLRTLGNLINEPFFEFECEHFKGMCYKGSSEFMTIIPRCKIKMEFVERDRSKKL